MNSDVPKPMYKIMGRPMIDHIVSSIESFNDIEILVVVGYKKELITEHLGRRVNYVVQKELKGTGHAILESADHIKKYDNVFILMGDSPFINKDIISQLMIEHKKNKSDCTFLYSSFPFKMPYARLVFDQNGKLDYLVEDSNAS